MYGQVPTAPENVDVVGVPPVVVEVPVGKVKQLPDQVQEGVEHDVEEYQPQQMVRDLAQHWLQTIYKRADRVK